MSDAPGSNRPEDTAISGTGSVFLRVDHPSAGRGSQQIVATLLEVEADGWIPREVGLAADGTPIYVTRPGEYGVFNDSGMSLVPPGTAEFDVRWRLAKQIPQEEFERAFGPAAAVLPETIGGTPIWQTDLLGGMPAGARPRCGRHRRGRASGDRGMAPARVTFAHAGGQRCAIV